MPMLRLPKGSPPLLNHRSQVNCSSSFLKGLAEPVQREFLENLEGVPTAQRGAVFHSVEQHGDLEVLLHLLCPLAKRSGVRLTVLPALEKHLRMRVETRLIVQGVRSAKEQHRKVAEGR